MLKKKVEIKRTLSRDEFYAAMGMFALAQQNMRASEKYRHALEKYLVVELNGYVCDAISDYPSENEDFEEVLRKEGIAVAPEPKRRGRKKSG